MSSTLLANTVEGGDDNDDEEEELGAAVVVVVVAVVVAEDDEDDEGADEDDDATVADVLCLPDEEYDEDGKSPSEHNRNLSNSPFSSLASALIPDIMGSLSGAERIIGTR
jgi:hypothetical protein